MTSTATTAYLGFFTSEIICHCSGIIAVVFCGLTTKAIGGTLLNDSHLTHDFWHTTEHLLNFILFALGGAVWITRVSSSSIEDNVNYFGGMDWVYLLLLFGLVVLRRFVLFFCILPHNVQYESWPKLGDYQIFCSLILSTPFKLRFLKYIV